jgi:hypothetical protein
MPLLLLLTHKQGTTNNAKALSSALPPMLLPSLHEQGAIDGVKASL